MEKLSTEVKMGKLILERASDLYLSTDGFKSFEKNASEYFDGHDEIYDMLKTAYDTSDSYEEYMDKVAFSIKPLFRGIRNAYRGLTSHGGSMLGAIKAPFEGLGNIMFTKSPLRYGGNVLRSPNDMFRAANIYTRKGAKRFNKWLDEAPEAVRKAYSKPTATTIPGTAGANIGGATGRIGRSYVNPNAMPQTFMDYAKGAWGTLTPWQKGLAVGAPAVGAVGYGLGEWDPISGGGLNIKLSSDDKQAILNNKERVKELIKLGYHFEDKVNPVTNKKETYLSKEKSILSEYR